MGLCLLASRELDFLYHELDDSISCNHCYLTKGVPARILKKLLEYHVYENRTYFEYREFKRDRELFVQPKTTNFEVRLRRLMKLVRIQLPRFRFEVIGPGKLHFSYAGEERLSIQSFRDPAQGMRAVVHR
ncbi:MAG: hypothetical protein JWO30_3120 [Fibrobacteres bacterium]|nr:hypothetical protein [Fibrobacterota bacterium]